VTAESGKTGNDKGKGRSDAPPQLLHLVFGGEVDEADRLRFSDLAGLDIVGIYPNYGTAYDAWKARAQATVDNARMRYFIVHLHRLLDPEAGAPMPGTARERSGA
jgi:hypothetical protein